MGSFTQRIKGPEVWSASTAAEATRIVRTVPCTFYTAVCENQGGATAYLQIFDRATALAGGEAPTLPPIQIIAGGTANYDFYQGGRPMNTGVVVALSSTAATYTAYANGWFDVGTR